MSKKKILFIILGFITIIICVAIFFVFRSTNINVAGPSSEPTTNKVNKMPQAATNSDNQSDSNSNSATTNNSVANSVTPLDPVIQAKYFNELRTNHPEFSATQIEFYNSTASQQDMSPCRGRQDEVNCVYAVALITRSYNFCGEIPDNKEKQLDCATIILNEKGSTEIAKCLAQTSDELKTQCLVSLFSVYEQAEDCRNLNIEETKKLCENVANFKIAQKKQDKNLCNSISSEFIKNTCLADIINISPPPIITNTPKDTDGDGLSDQDELNKYFTNPLLADTDGDTFSDGAEVSGGYNPCGDGKLPALELLPELCAQFTK